MTSVVVENINMKLEELNKQAELIGIGNKCRCKIVCKYDGKEFEGEAELHKDAHRDLGLFQDEVDFGYYSYAPTSLKRLYRFPAYGSFVEHIKQLEPLKHKYVVGDEIEVVDGGWGSVESGTVGVIEEVDDEDDVYSFRVKYKEGSAWFRSSQIKFVRHVGIGMFAHNPFAQNSLYKELQEGIDRTNNNKTNNKKPMSKITKFVKDLTLSTGEKLLRKYELKDECGNYSEDYNELRRIEQNKAFEETAIAHCVELEKEDKKKK